MTQYRHVTDKPPPRQTDRRTNHTNALRQVKSTNWLTRIVVGLQLY